MTKGNVDLRQAKQVAVIIAVSVALLNVAFYFLSQMYYDDRLTAQALIPADRFSAEGAVSVRHGFDMAALKGSRFAFAILTSIVGLTAIAAQFAPRYVSHSLAVLVGLIALVGSVITFRKDFHVVLPVALGVAGVALIELAYLSLRAKSRASWAFLTAFCAVGALVMLFGATKVRNALDVSLYYTLIVPGILVVATVMLITISDDYAEPTERSA
jgi:fucose 4-O-acetylase-like acetyltransferase